MSDLARLDIDLESEIPVYRQIADGVKQAARGGELDDGARLPATRDLARQLGVNRNTVIAAYDALAAEGWVRGQTGRGTFLNLPGHGGADADAPDAWFTAFSRAVTGVEQGGLDSILTLATSEEGISFVGSYPAPELMPVAEFRRALERALDRHGAAALSYGPTAGLADLREAIAERMARRGSPATADEILVTQGAQQALDLTLRAFLDPGDSIVVEEPTYTGVLSVLGSLGARGIGVPLDDEGMRPDLLELALSRHRPKLIYVQPNFQNPTTVVMSEERRRRLLDLAERHRVPVVEDDWSGDLRIDGEDLPSLHALDRGRHVVHLGTFSKKLMPGLRLGWAAAPGPVLARLVQLKRAQDCGSSPLLQAALASFLRDGGLERHLAVAREAYRARRDRMIAALERHFPAEARWTRPAGGLFLWVVLPPGFDGTDLWVEAKRRGILYSRGELFHGDGSGRHTLRLTYSAATPEQIDAGIEELGALVRERMESLDPQRNRPVEAMPIL